MTNLAIINAETLICENVTVDDRPASEIQIDGYIVLDLLTTICVSWYWDGTDWVEQESMGEGSIGDTYQNGKLYQEKPKEQPVTDLPSV
jgi:hypothetical protein